MSGISLSAEDPQVLTSQQNNPTSHHGPVGETRQTIHLVEKISMTVFSLTSLLLLIAGFLSPGDEILLIFLVWGYSLVVWLLAWGWKNRGHALVMAIFAAAVTSCLVIDYAIVAIQAFTGRSEQFIGISSIGFVFTGPLLIVAAFFTHAKAEKIGMILAGGGFALWVPVALVTWTTDIADLLLSAFVYAPIFLGSLIVLFRRPAHS